MQNDKKKVILLATGGTIAGTGEQGKSTGYASGSVAVGDIIAAIPDLADIAELETVQICNINSDDVTDAIWLELARVINERAAEDDVVGFVITHGTDTMDETAYFLNLTVKTEKPVVLTGSMRPATALSADGAMNLWQAVCVAAAPAARGRGVLVVMAYRILAARHVQKQSTYSIAAMGGGELGVIGTVRDGEVRFYASPERRHTVNSEFSVQDLQALPKVGVFYFHADADPELMRYMLNKYEGLIIAGAGCGEYSLLIQELIKKAAIPVVISSRVGSGVIPQGGLACKSTVAADDLPPQKAAVLLRLALTVPHAQNELIRIFAQY